MLLGFVSDLHLAPPPLNRCTTPPDELCALLDRLERRCDRVILVGDVYDLSRPPTPRGWREHLARTLLAFPALCARLERCERVFGNHDVALANLGTPEEIAIHGGVGPVLILHGHQWDVWLKKIWGLEEAANFCVGWLDRAGLGALGERIGQLPAALERLPPRLAASSLSAGDASPRHVSGAAPLFEAGWRVVVAGHSHALGIEVMPGGELLVNTGAHIHGHRDAALLDTSSGLALTIRDGAPHEAARLTGEGWRLADALEVAARLGFDLNTER